MDVAEILACGGELKNTFCLTKGRYAVLSQHIGDMENYETLVFLRRDAGQSEEAVPGATRARSRTICIRRT